MTTKNKFKIQASIQENLCMIQAENAPVKTTSFSGIAYSGGSIKQPWLDVPIVIDISALHIATQIPLLYNHKNEPQTRLGYNQCKSNGCELAVTGQITAKNEYAKCILDGKELDWQLSVGVDIVQYKMIDANETINVNGRSFNGPICLVMKGILREISVVAVGADEETHMRIAAGYANKNNHKKGNQMKPELQTFIRARYKLAEDTDTVSITAHLKTIERTEEQEQTDFDAIRAALPENPVPLQSHTLDMQAVTAAATQAAQTLATAERCRISEINEIFGEDFPHVRAAAISDGLNADQARKKLLDTIRAERPTAGKIGINSNRNQETDSNKIIMAAALLSGGMKGELVVKATNEQAVEQAGKKYRSGIGLQQMLIEAARANGFSGFSIRGFEREVIAAAFATMDLPGIFSSVANKFLLASFNAVESVYEQISAERSVSDFKEITSYRMTSDMMFEEFAPSGELKNGKLSEEKYTNRAATYGKLFSLTREDIINDDLGAMIQIPQLIGRGAKLKLNMVFWTEFLKSAFYSTANGNLLTGTDSVLGIDSLTASEVKFMEQTDKEGNPLAFTPKFLLVPPALKVAAERIFKDTFVENSDAKKTATTGNPHAGKFQPICSTYLSNAKISGSSSKAWYLLSDPRDSAAIEICYLNGNKNPIVESAQADFENLGIKFRGYWDFGVRQQEPKAILKNKGE